MQKIDVYFEFGKRVAFLRKQKGWSQEDLALESGIATSYLCEVEKGKRNPTLNVINRLAKAFGIKIEELFKGIDGDIG